MLLAPKIANLSVEKAQAEIQMAVACAHFLKSEVAARRAIIRESEANRPHGLIEYYKKMYGGF